MSTSFDLSKVAAASVHLPSQAIADYLFDPSGPKFLFDDIYHFSMRHYARHQNNRNMLPVVKFMLSTVLNHTMGQKMPLMLVPEAITNGKLYYDLAEKHERRLRDVRGGHLTTYRMGEILNKDELSALTEKNKNRAMKRLEGFQKLNPDALVISPTGMEAMLKTLINEPGFSNYQMLRDEDFEAFWIGVCFASQRGGFSDEVAYSRNGNFETFALFQTRYGLVPFRPKGDTEVSFPDKKSITPFDYTQMLFTHLLDVVPRGFTSDLSVKMMMRMIMLEEMRTMGMPHPVWGALDFNKMNSDLRNLPRQHDREFKVLKRDILKFMIEYNLGAELGDMAGLNGYDGLENFFFEKITDIGPMTKGAIFSGDGGHPAKSVENLDMDSVLKKKNLVDSHGYKIPYQLDGEFFCANPPIFDKQNFERCTQVEQLALRTFMGLIETPKPPLAKSFEEQGNIFVLIDRRGGQEAQRYSMEKDCLIPSEARGLNSSFTDANFEEIVKTENIKKSDRLCETIARLNPKTLITSLEDIEHDFETFRLHRHAFVSPGPDRLSSLAKIAYGQEILRRSTRLAIFDQSWENSPVLTALRLYARKIQLGLIDRPLNMPRHAITISDTAGDNGEMIVPSLRNDLTTLTNYMESLVGKKTEDYPQHVVNALLETVTFINLYYNEDMNMAANTQNGHGLIDWQSVPMSTTEGVERYKEDVLKTRDRAKNFILNHGLTALSSEDVEGPLELIDPEYAQAKRQQDADQKIARDRRPRESSYQKIRGFNAA